MGTAMLHPFTFSSAVSRSSKSCAETSGLKRLCRATAAKSPGVRPLNEAMLLTAASFRSNPFESSTFLVHGERSLFQNVTAR